MSDGARAGEVLHGPHTQAFMGAARLPAGSAAPVPSLFQSLPPLHQPRKRVQAIKVQALGRAQPRERA